MNERRQQQRSYSIKYRAPPLPPRCEKISTLPETFISSLRQLFSILDKTNSGSIPFDLFKEYFDKKSLPIDFLTELEIESKFNQNLITFNLLLNVIQRVLNSTKPIHRSISKRSNREIPIFYRSANQLNTSNPIDFAMIRALKQFEIERNLLIETTERIDRVKNYLTNCLNEMKLKEKSYCQSLSLAERTSTAPELMYNRDLIADLYKLATTVLQQVQTDSSEKDINNQIKAKDDYIKRLETEKGILLKELIEMKQQYGTIS